MLSRMQYAYTLLATLSMFAALWIPAPCKGQSLVLISGNGPEGGLDSQIRFKNFGNLQANIPTSADFAAAQAGSPAMIFPNSTSALDGFTPLADYPTAHMVGVTSGGSALYAMPFTITDPGIAAASLDFEFHVDNYLGGAPLAAQGLYLNGTPLSGDTRFYDPADQAIYFSGTISRNDIAPLLIPQSTNWLYINVTDRLPGSGVWFGATIRTTATPEPSTLVMLCAASGAICFPMIRKGRGRLLGAVSRILRRR